MKLLCHYTNDKAAKIILNDLSLRFGKFIYSNDPIEIKKMEFYNKGTDEETMEMISNDLTDYLNKILQMMCFCDGEYPITDDDFFDKNGPSLHDFGPRPPFYFPRMWAMYGENHSGVCFVFEKKLLFAQICNQIKMDYHYKHNNITYINFLDSGALAEMCLSHNYDNEELKILKPKGIIQNISSRKLFLELYAKRY
jgi:hypothetical protein